AKSSGVATQQLSSKDSFALEVAKCSSSMIFITRSGNALEHFIPNKLCLNFNDVKQIYATVNGKTMVISESSVRSDLHFNDEYGITCLSNDEIFVNLALMGVVRAATTATSLEAEQESGNINKTRSMAKLNELSPQGTYSGSGPRCQDTTLGDADAQTRFETTSKQSYDPPLSEVNTSGSGEDSMEHQDDLKDFVPPTPCDSPLSGDHILGSDECRPNITKLMAISTQLSNRVLAWEQSKIAQDLSLDKKDVSKQGRNLKTRLMFKEGDIDDNRDDIDDMVDEAIDNVEGDTVNIAGAVNTATAELSAASALITTNGVSISTAKLRTPPTSIATIFEDLDLTIAQTLVKMRNKGKGITQEPKKPPKNPRMAQIQLDEELAKRMHEEEKAELEKRQSKIAATEEASRAVIKAAINQVSDDIQAMIEADEQMASRLQSEEQEQFTIKEKSRMLVEMIAKMKREGVMMISKNSLKKHKQVNSFISMDSKVVKDSGKKNDGNSKQARSMKKRPGSKIKPKSPSKLKVMKEQESAEDEQEKEELKLCLKIVQDEDKAINYETLDVKSLIVDWETQLLGSDLQGEDLSYWKITRTDRSFRFYKVFLTMLEEFDKQDLFDLYRLVMKRFESVAPEGYDLILQGDLETMIEPNEEDEV
nr:hypothetical protein [Tanacetum cinerariifolium]